tara:strand:+ start:389 stop:1672 length:1284 start_codon:yes stop_codon:yes gene_type:complete
MNLLFLSDTLGIEGPVIRQVFLEYMKLDSNLTSFNFFNNIKILEDISNDKYIVFYDTFNGVEAFEKMINDESDISKKIISDLKNNKCYIIFFQTDCCGWQYSIYEEHWKSFKNLLQENELSKNNFGFIFHESILNAEKEEANKVELDFLYFNRNAAFTYYPDSFANNSRLDTSTLFKILNNSKGYYRQFKYASHNNNIKDHRVELLLFLIKNNLLEDGITTWFGGQEPLDQGITQIDFTKFNSAGYGIHDYSKEYGKDVIKFANKYVPNTYDLKVQGLQDYLNIVPYFNSYFNIVTESCWGPGYDKTVPQKIHITEKVWKSFVTFQPFILISTKNNLKKLREWGFKTFHSHIDESYDELETYEERKNAINKEIIRLCSMTQKELDIWYWEMEDILLYNSEHFIHFVDTEYNKLEIFIKKGLEKINEV